MQWLDDIGEYLQAQGIGTLAVDIFYKDFDPKTDNCIYLTDQVGLPSKYTLRRTMVLERPELGIRVRNVDDVTADLTAGRIENLLDGKTNTIIGETRFKSIWAIAPHFFLEQDDEDRFTYSINFKTEIG